MIKKPYVKKLTDQWAKQRSRSLIINFKRPMLALHQKCVPIVIISEHKLKLLYCRKKTCLTVINALQRFCVGNNILELQVY